MFRGELAAVISVEVAVRMPCLTLRSKNLTNGRWMRLTLLLLQVIWDTAAYAPCHPINLAEVPADFICLSL